MPRQSGRPSKTEQTKEESKSLIIDTTIQLIQEHGADNITVRKICQAADIATGTFYYHFHNKDDLMMYFLRETSFEMFRLTTPIEDIAGRICELYMHLIHRYMELGDTFMKSFYTTSNRALSAYMGEVDGAFEEGTVMYRCEQELLLAREHRILKKQTDIHELSMDICTIVKGCVFEWCLTDGTMDIAATLQRMLQRYMANYIH